MGRDLRRGPRSACTGRHGLVSTSAVAVVAPRRTHQGATAAISQTDGSLREPTRGRRRYRPRPTPGYRARLRDCTQPVDNCRSVRLRLRCCDAVLARPHHEAFPQGRSESSPDPSDRGEGGVTGSCAAARDRERCRTAHWGDAPRRYSRGFGDSPAPRRPSRSGAFRLHREGADGRLRKDVAAPRPPCSCALVTRRSGVCTEPEVLRCGTPGVSGLSGSVRERLRADTFEDATVCVIPLSFPNLDMG